MYGITMLKCITFRRITIMITLLTRENFIEKFKEILSLAKDEIKIISPFIGKRTAVMISEMLKGRNEIKCKIITRFYREDFIQDRKSVV